MKHGHGWLGAISAIALLGCSDIDAGIDGEEAAAAPGEEDVESGSSAIVPTAEFMWSLGSPPVAMVPVAGWSCFLTGVGGTLQDLGHFVRIAPMGGMWRLSGGGVINTRVRGWARCMPTPAGAESGVVSVAASPVPASVALGNPMGTCLLTHIGGRFIDGNRVALQQGGGGWQLQAVSPGAASQVSARARCINLPVSPPLAGWESPAAPVGLGPVPARACFLMAVGAGFMVPTSQAKTMMTPMQWQIGGSMGTPPPPGGPAARGFCVK